MLTAPISKADNLLTSTWVTGSGATITNGGATVPIDDYVQMTIDYTNDTIIINPLNLESNLTRDFQLISHIDFHLSNLSAGTTSSVTASSFKEINYSTSATSAVAVTPANVWQALLTAGGAMTFCANCNGSGNSELIIGAPNPTSGTNELYNSPGNNPGLYTHAPAILGDGATYASGPLAGLNSSPSWTISVPEITLNTTITSVSFGFGTAGGITYTAQNAVPEPSTSMQMAGAGAVLLAAVWSRKRFRQAKASAQ